MVKKAIYNFDELVSSEAVRQNALYAHWSEEFVVVQSELPEEDRRYVEVKLIELGVIYNEVQMSEEIR